MRQIDAPGGYALRPKPYATVVTALETQLERLTPNSTTVDTS